MEKLTVVEEIVVAALLKGSEQNMASLVESGLSETLTKMLIEDLQTIRAIRRKLDLDAYNPSK
jgi:flagellar motor switch protein FliG